jgi:hypothetical protein
MDRYAVFGSVADSETGGAAPYGLSDRRGGGEQLSAAVHARLYVNRGSVTPNLMRLSEVSGIIGGWFLR